MGIFKQCSELIHQLSWRLINELAISRIMVFIKDVRLKQYDYGSSGYYFVTAVCNYRQNFFLNKENLVKLNC